MERTFKYTPSLNEDDEKLPDDLKGYISVYTIIPYDNALKGTYVLFIMNNIHEEDTNNHTITVDDNTARKLIELKPDYNENPSNIGEDVLREKIDNEGSLFFQVI